MIVQDVCSARKYEKDGEEKTAWRKVGELKTFESGKQCVELFQTPDVYYGVFDQKPREEQPQATQVGSDQIPF